MKRKANLNATNGGVEPWVQGASQRNSGDLRPMRLPHDTDDSDEEGPREITRENFGNTITKFPVNYAALQESTEIKKKEHEIHTGPPTAINYNLNLANQAEIPDE